MRLSRKVPFVPQQSATECAYACLAMMLGAQGRKTGLSEIRSAFPIGRDGVGTLRIAAIADSFGLVAKIYNTQSTDFRCFKEPLMLHWGMSHWLILESCSRRKYRVADPAVGKRTISAAEFSNHFTGVFIRFCRNSRFEERPKAPLSAGWRMLFRVFAEVSGRPLVTVVLAASLIVQVLGLTLPVLIKVVTDQIIPSHITAAMPLVLCAVIVIGATLVVAELLRSLAVLRLRTQLDARAMADVAANLLQLPFSFFQLHSRGDLMTRISGFTNLRQLLSNTGVASALDGAFVAAYLVWLLYANIPLGAIVLGIVAIEAAALALAAKAIRDASKSLYAASAKQNAYLIDTLSGIEYLKASGSEKRAISRWTTLLGDQLAASNRVAYINVAVSCVSTMCTIGAPFAALCLGTRLVLAGIITPGTMLGALALVGMLFPPLSRLTNFCERLQEATAYVERLDDIIATPKERLNPGGRVPVSRGEIELRRVSFAYPGTSLLTLRDISLRVCQGEMVAVVGATGCGKSTLAKLVTTLEAPTGGDILYGGIAEHDIDVEEFRRRLGFVPQNPVLFQATLRDNIAFGLPGARLEQVIEAAKRACIHEEISRLPLKYESAVSEQGLNFSGGQRQRIAIARAVLREPQILVLDEATSHLDSETEQRVLAMIAAFRCTRIIIAHRLSTVRKADRIFVLDAGNLVESGSHTELLAKNGRYAAMLRYQTEDATGVETSACRRVG